MRLYPQFTSWDNPKVPERPLVIGYVSPDYFTHSVSYFIEAPLVYHDYANYMVVVYSAVVKVCIPWFVSITYLLIFEYLLMYNFMDAFLLQICLISVVIWNSLHVCLHQTTRFIFFIKRVCFLNITDGERWLVVVFLE
jgi:hypothetical protein